MNSYDKILEIVKKNNGYITTSEVVNNHIERRFLTNMVKRKMLIRISRGYYGLTNYVEDEYYKIISKSKNARFSLATALYLHGLSDRNPLVYNITLPYGYNGRLQKEKKLCLILLKENSLI